MLSGARRRRFWARDPGIPLVALRTGAESGARQREITAHGPEKLLPHHPKKSWNPRPYHQLRRVAGMGLVKLVPPPGHVPNSGGTKTFFPTTILPWVSHPASWKSQRVSHLHHKGRAMAVTASPLRWVCVFVGLRNSTQGAHRDFAASSIAGKQLSHHETLYPETIPPHAGQGHQGHLSLLSRACGKGARDRGPCCHLSVEPFPPRGHRCGGAATGVHALA